MRETVNTILLLLMVGWTAVVGSHSQESPKKQTALGVQQDYKIVKQPTVIGVAQQKKIDADAALAQEVLSQASKCLSEGSPGYRTIRGCPVYNKIIATAGTRFNVDWDKLSMCETGGESGTKTDSEPTGGNWFDTTGAYPGGLGMMRAAWRQDNIYDFPANAGNATRLEQIVVSENTYARAPDGWSCPITPKN